MPWWGWLLTGLCSGWAIAFGAIAWWLNRATVNRGW